MRYRRLGRTGARVSEVGLGLWGMGGWSDADDRQSRAALQLAADLGCTFFDSAWDYGNGKSDRLLGELLAHRAGGDRPVFAATKSGRAMANGRRTPAIATPTSFLSST